MTIKTLSEPGARFTIDKEGNVLRAYRDPTGTVTIGPGLTNGSVEFKRIWTALKGRPLQMGDTMTETQSMSIFRQVADREYGPAVATKVIPEKQHHFDAAFDMTYNCGKGALDWKWAVALRDKLIARSAALLRQTALTSKGVRLNGLVRRRDAAAKLLEFADYGRLPVIGASPSIVESRDLGSAASTTVEEVKAYQEQLHKLGYYAGDIDGLRGPLTSGAIRNFQRDNDITVDGIVGPATRATLERRLQDKHRNQIALGAGAATMPFLGLDSPLWYIAIAVGCVVTVYVGLWLWNNRGRLKGVLNA